LVLGLQVPHRLAARAPALAWMNSRVAEVGWWLAVLALVSWRSVLRFDEIESFELYGLLPVLGLASAVAAPLATRSVRCQSGAAFALLLAYWLAFALYPLPWTESAAAGAATVVGGAAFSGFLAHWNPGTHVAAAFDIWLLNLFPRGEPYVPPAHGFHTLRFVAVAALLLFGMAIGQTLRNATSRERIRDRLFFAALAAISVALLLSLGIEPIVNRIWTSAWTLFSGGVVLILFLGAYSLIDLRGRRRYLAPLVVAGTNSLLLYVLALSVRWPVLEAWRRILGPRVFEGYWQPVLESLAFGLSLWAIAALLQRFRLFVRL
jgi:predicted acyltransferase